MAEGQRTGLFQNAIPQGAFNIMETQRLTTGVRFYVLPGHANGGDSGGKGVNPDAPFLTLTYALTQCVANRGDIIYLMPGYVELISAAADIDLNVAGVTIIGIGNGTLRPTFRFDTIISADMDVTAAGITVENVIFSANFADITAAIDVDADDFTLRNCRFEATAANMNFLIMIQDAAATASDRITVEDCYYLDRDASNTHFINFAGTGDGHIIRRNTILGDFGTICIGGAGIVTNVTVEDNIISNASNVNDSCINFAATSTGICVRNLCCGAAAQANGITATAMTIAENYYGVVTEDLSAILDPPNA
jgi:hypothetical protein